jgi:hypothetical protein
MQNESYYIGFIILRFRFANSCLDQWQIRVNA